MSTITVPRALLQQALEALERCNGYRNWPWMQEAIDALRERLEGKE